MKRASVSFVGVALLVGACGHSGPYPDWAVSRTRNVRVYTEARLEHEYIQQWLELSHAAFRAFFPTVSTGPVDVVWLKNEPGSFFRLNNPFDDPQYGWTLEGVPTGGGRIGRNGLIVLERREELTSGPGGFDRRSVRDEGIAKRQMAHLFIMKAVPLAPLWLQIGLARYMARYRVHYRGDKAVACFGSPVFDEAIATSNGRMAGGGRRVTIPLDELLHTDWYGYDGRRRYWYEFTAYALVHYLIHGERGWNGSRLPTLLKALREGRPSEEALALAYPNVLEDEWDDRIDEHVRPSRGAGLLAANPNLVQGLCLHIPPVKETERKPERTPANPAEIEAMMNDLERVDPFHRHAAWLPQDIVEAEAAKHPSRRRPRPAAPGPEAPNPIPSDQIPTIRR